MGSQQVRSAAVRVGCCPRPRQGRRVVEQLGELAGSSAYGSVVLGCLVLKNYQRSRPSGPPRRCLACWGAEQMVCNKTASEEEGEGALSKVPRAVAVAGALPPPSPWCHQQRARAGTSALWPAGWAAAQCLFPCACAPVKRLTSTSLGFWSQIQPQGSGCALPVPLHRAVRSSARTLLSTNLHPPASGGIFVVKRSRKTRCSSPGEGPGSCFAVPKSALVSLQG